MLKDCLGIDESQQLEFKFGVGRIDQDVVSMFMTKKDNKIIDTENIKLYIMYNY